MRSESAAHDQPREGPQPPLRPLARRVAYSREAPRPDEPVEGCDECPDLGEGDGAVDAPVCFRAGVGCGGRHALVGVCASCVVSESNNTQVRLRGVYDLLVSLLLK